jgi:hypothetical protein
MRSRSGMYVLLLCVSVASLSAQESRPTTTDAIASVVGQRSHARASGNTTVVLPLALCWQILPGDPLCPDGRLSATAADIAQVRADILARSMGVELIQDQRFVANWRTPATLGIDLKRCSTEPTLSIVSPLSVADDSDERSVLVRIHSATYPKNGACDGSAIVSEYRVSAGADRRAIVTSAKSIVHFSGLRSPK